MRWSTGAWEFDGQWRPWFAWFPVTAWDGKASVRVWLEWIEYRWDRSDVIEFSCWEYRIPGAKTSVQSPDNATVK